jgi:hypothetical protein
MNQETPMHATTKDTTRRTALIAGLLYLLTFISIPILALYNPVTTHADWILGTGTGVVVGGLLELIVALAGIGTAVVLFPVVKRQNEAAALGFVATRILEAGIIFAGVFSLLSAITLRLDVGGATGADATALVATGRSLVAFHDWTFLLGQALMPVLNAFLLGSLMLRSGLVPRIIPIMGLIGAPLLLVSTLGTLFGINDQVSALSGLATLPIFLWELSLGLYLTFKGFRSTAPVLATATVRSQPAAMTTAGAA